MRRIRKILCFLLPLAALLLASCEEVQEASKYDNWQARNEAQHLVLQVLQPAVGF